MMTYLSSSWWRTVLRSGRDLAPPRSRVEQMPSPVLRFLRLLRFLRSPLRPGTSPIPPTPMSPCLVALVVALAMQSFGCASSPAPQEQFSIEKPVLMISGGPAPKYPSELLATGDTGTVIVRVTVNPEGRPVMSSAKVIASPHPAFSKAALAVIREYRFIPAEVGGTPMRCPPEGESRRCKPGRPGRKVAMPVDIPFVFRAPQPPAAGA